MTPHLLKTTLFACALALLLLAGCGDSDSDTDAAPTRGEACQTLGESTCDKLLTCNLTFTDRALCEEQVVATCCEDDGACADPLSEQEAAGFSQCTADIEADDCDGFGSPPPDSCQGLPTGL